VDVEIGDKLHKGQGLKEKTGFKDSRGQGFEKPTKTPKGKKLTLPNQPGFLAFL
jgi:hypothetical protein